MKIAIGNDHAGILLKREIVGYLAGKEEDMSVTDYGAQDKPGLDYPDYAWEICNKVLNSGYVRGILLCGTGAGMCMAANKVCGIRAVVCSDPYTAQLARAHNDANVLCIGARVVGGELAKLIVDAFIEAPFEGGRHALRVAKIMNIETKNLSL